MTLPSSRLICTGCGAKPDPADPYPFRCPNAGRDDDVDHVLRRRLDLYNVRFPLEDTQRNPFLRYRRLLHAYHAAVAGGMSDEEFCALVKRLDRADHEDQREEQEGERRIRHSLVPPRDLRRPT